jgi:YNFM family putative membrane transporter
MTAGAATISVPISVPISATISAAISAATRRSIFLLSLAAFSSMAAQRNLAALFPELSRVFAVSLAQAAQVVSIFAVVYGLSQLFYGPLGDRLGKSAS